MRPGDPHASGCRFDGGLVPIGVPYRVIAPDGTILDGVGRHRDPVCAVVYYAQGGWRLYSSHTTVDAARKVADGAALRHLAPAIVDVCR
jgi:hypothetical protein